MRIGKTKKEYSPREYSKDEIDCLNDNPKCNNCHCTRLKLHRANNNSVNILVCINKECFLYTDITKLQSWIK